MVAFTDSNELDNKSLMKPIWTVDDLSKITGLARQTIYNKISEIPHRKKCGRLYFIPEEILNWIDEGDLD